MRRIDQSQSLDIGSNRPEATTSEERMRASCQSLPKTSDDGNVQALFQSILPDAVIVRGGRLDVAAGPLFATERLAMQTAGTKRRREFTAGRYYARAALASLGCPIASIDVSSDRCPIWPEGVVGSITHTDCHAAAALSRRRDLKTVGIDLEQPIAMAPQLVELIATMAEQRAWAERPWPPQLRPYMAITTFSAKESVYKAYYPLRRRMLNFSDIRIDYADDGDTFRVSATATSDDNDLFAAIEGRFTITEYAVATSATLPA